MTRVWFREVGCAAVFLAFAVTPADAVEGNVTGHKGVLVTEVGNGFVATAFCQGFAVPAVDPLRPDRPDVPLSTTVVCSINGARSSVTADGPTAVAVVSTVALPTITTCIEVHGIFTTVVGVVYAKRYGPLCTDDTPR